MSGKHAIALLSLMIFSSTAHAEFDLSDDGSALTLSEKGRLVLTYHYAMVEPPEGVPERYRRSCYIHPLYGLDGDILTQDFPPDHRHHRGIFWAWPNSTVGDRLFNLWLIQEDGEVGARQHFEKWLSQEAGDATAEIGVQNVWRYDDTDQASVREKVWMIVHPSDANSQAIDFRLTWENVCEDTVTLLGADRKGYGGFCIRPDASRRPLQFNSIEGEQPDDVLELDTPWSDVTSRVEPDGPTSGMALFQHPENPGYPHRGWIFRHYGFLGASWPHLEPYEIAPGESVTLRYRMLIHRGTAEEAKVGEAFEKFVNEMKGK
ncbi:MAG: PmoA family protein [Candidatus Omnitrophica bacterium]|nr:PmoA family protein [Candidatus Omnitrophota bacterium]